MKVKIHQAHNLIFTAQNHGVEYRAVWEYPMLTVEISPNPICFLAGGQMDYEGWRLASTRLADMKEFIDSILMEVSKR